MVASKRRVAGGAAGDQVAGRDPPVADAAVDRRAQFGEFDVERRLTHGRLVVVHGGLRVAEGLRALLEDLVGDGLVVHQLLAARVVGLGEGEIGFGLRQIGARLIERVLERPLVDGEQQIALLDDLPVLEMHAVEIAGDARAHLHRIDCGKAADIFVVIGDGSFDRLGDGDRRRRRCAGLLLPLRRNLRPKSQVRTARQCSGHHTSAKMMDLPVRNS